MTNNVLRALTVGAAVALLAGCAGAGSSLDRSGAGSLAANGLPAPSLSLHVDTYPIGAYGGKTRAELLAAMRPMHGSLSYDARGAALVYASNLGGNSVEVFNQRGKNQQPIATITNGIVFPAGLTTDKKGNLYVADEGQNGGQWTVPVYPPGATSPSKTYSTDLSTPTDTAVANDGTVYISNFNSLSNGWVAVYPKGNTAKEYRLSDFSGGAPLSVALDAKQNLYVMYDLNGSGSSAVNEYKPGAKKGTNLGLAFKFGAGVQVDSVGDVLVVQQVEPSEILVFPAGQTQPSQIITLPSNGQPFNFAVNRRSKALFAGDTTANFLDRLALPSGKFQYNVAGGFNNPSGAAVAPAEF
jgi:sugar lactone lactonase YvrE